MRQVVEFRTMPSGESYKAYKRFQWLRKNRGWLIFFILLLVAAGAYLIFMRSQWLFGLILIAVGVFTPLILGWIINFKAKRYQKRMNRTGGINCLYRISREEFVIETETPAGKTVTETGWGSVEGVVETTDWFFVYVERKEPVILPKRDQVSGSAFLAREILWDPNRYKYRKML